MLPRALISLVALREWDLLSVPTHQPHREENMKSTEHAIQAHWDQRPFTKGKRVCPDPCGNANVRPVTMAATLRVGGGGGPQNRVDVTLLGLIFKSPYSTAPTVGSSPSSSSRQIKEARPP